jgi:two-component system chemotaxis sensor kinase CheA
MRLPVTFGLLRSLVIVSSANRYCLDASQVVGTATVDASEITKAGNTLQSHTEVMPVVWMRELLGQKEAEPTDTPLEVITCEFSSDSTHLNKRVAIVVDQVEGTEEILVRNLGRHAGRWHGVVGATELGNGSVALVLDVPSLL